VTMPLAVRFIQVWAVPLARLLAAEGGGPADGQGGWGYRTVEHSVCLL
jgi:hypothetical protein